MEVVRVRSAEDMARAVGEKSADATIVAMAAAVSDYRPAEVAPTKLKKGDGPAHLDLVRTPDILRGLGADKRGRFLIGFAAETDRVRENARAKLAEKRLDLMVANDVTREQAGFGVDTNAAVLIDASGEREVPLVSKRELAERIWDRVVEMRTGTPRD
jgi:phosphopantothenoylcysteine decarboxylase/phosphopantothenate--cysteine ligase